MAKIIEHNVIITISKLVKNDEDMSSSKLDGEFKEQVLYLVSELLGSEYIVELTASE